MEKEINMTLAVLFDIEPNPDSELLAKVILEKFLKDKGVVKESDSYYGYKEVIVYEQKPTNNR
jgi:hypothetical protein